MGELRHQARFRRDHRWAQGQMSAYLDGELTASRRTRLEGHTTECEQCRRLLNGLRQMLGLLERLPPPTGGSGALALAASVRVRLPAPPSSS
jgi:anti-sigma factor RsiW